MSFFYIAIILISRLSTLLHPLVVMAIGGIVITILSYTRFESRDENGITYVIKKRHQEETVPLDVGAKKFINSSIVVGTGLPVGREAPALLIGSAIASKIVKLAKIPEDFQYQAITLGGAASTGALFQAPFGAAVFSAEIPFKEDLDSNMLVAAFLSSVIAAFTAGTIIRTIGDQFSIFNLDLFLIGDAFLTLSVKNILLAVLLGMIAGIIGRGFIDFYYFYSDRVISRFEPHRQILYGLIGTLVVIYIGILLVGDLYITRGTSSFEGIREFTEDPKRSLLRTLFIVIIIQILATTLIIGSGYPGGIFAPSLAIGALTGIAFSILLGSTDTMTVTAWSIIGMSAGHAATTKTPIASVLLILEITGLPDLIIPLVLANISSYVVSGHRSLYKGQIRSRNAAVFKELKEYDQHEGFTVQEVMTELRNVFYVQPTTSIFDMKRMLEESSKRDFPVIAGELDYHVVGMITEYDIMKSAVDDELQVDQVMTKKVVSVKSTMTGKEALAMMLDFDIERAPVVDDEDYLIGIVSIRDIVRGHQTLIEVQQITSEDN